MNLIHFSSFLASYLRWRFKNTISWGQSLLIYLRPPIQLRSRTHFWSRLHTTLLLRRLPFLKSTLASRTIAFFHPSPINSTSHNIDSFADDHFWSRPRKSHHIFDQSIDGAFEIWSWKVLSTAAFYLQLS